MLNVLMVLGTTPGCDRDQSTTRIWDVIFAARLWARNSDIDFHRKCICGHLNVKSVRYTENLGSDWNRGWWFYATVSAGSPPFGQIRCLRMLWPERGESFLQHGSTNEMGTFLFAFCNFCCTKRGRVDERLYTIMAFKIHHKRVIVHHDL